MITSLALKNIKQKKLRTFLGSLSITISAAALIVFLGLSAGIKQATFDEIEKKSPLTQITVQPGTQATGVISFLNKGADQTISQETIQQISQIPGVKSVYPEIQFDSFASLEAEILGFSFITDTMIFGVPQEFVSQDLPENTNWEATKEPYPAIVPSKILDLYNLAIAAPKGLPQLSEENIIGREITLFPNYSTFFSGSGKKSDSLKLKIVGFSNKTNLLGITLPPNLVEDLNQKYNSTSPTILELFVETMDATQVPTVAAQIETLGFSTQYLQKNLQEVSSRFTYLTVSLGAISLIILLIAAIAIVNTFLAQIAERRREIGLFRALGATKSQIRNLILTEAAVIGLVGSLLGLLLGLLAAKALDAFALGKLAITTFTPEAVILITPALIAKTILFSLLLAITAAYLPARKAANINPIEALK